MILMQIWCLSELVFFVAGLVDELLSAGAGVCMFLIGF
jgi:hypothetical protein